MEITNRQYKYRIKREETGKQTLFESYYRYMQKSNYDINISELRKMQALILQNILVLKMSHTTSLSRTYFDSIDVDTLTKKRLM